MTAFLIIPPIQIFLPKSRAGAGSTKPKEISSAALHPAGETDWTVKRALTNSAFWLLFIARTLASLGNQVIVTHQIAHAIDVGYSSVFAASIFGLMGVISIAGRILFGYLADVMNRELVFTWVQVVSAVGIFALLAMQDASTGRCANRQTGRKIRTRKIWRMLMSCCGNL